MNKLRIISLILLIFGIGVLFSVNISGLGAPQPTSFVNVETTSILDESIPFATLTEYDRETFPVLFHAMENGITHIDVYPSQDVPEGGMSEREYYAISDLFETDVVFYIGPGDIKYEGTIYHIYIGAIAGQDGFAESLANFLRFTSKVLIFAGAVLITVSFVRSVSSTAPESRAMQIQLYIEEHPGCSEADIVKNVGYSRSSTVHHLRTLIRDRRIREVTYHKTIRYYPAGISEGEHDLFDAASAKEKPAKILSALEKKPMTIADLKEETGISEPSLRWYLARLEEDGIIISRKSGTRVCYSLSK